MRIRPKHGYTPMELMAEEARVRSVQVMGLELGKTYEALWQEIVWLNRTWAEYATLCCTSRRKNVFGASCEASTSMSGVASDLLENRICFDWDRRPDRNSPVQKEVVLSTTSTQ